MTQLNSIKAEIKNTQERINLMEKEKKYLLVISQEHNKCIDYKNKLQEDINYFQTELKLLKIENKEKVKIKIEKYKNDTKSNNNIYKGLSPEEIRQKKEQHIKNSLDEFWAVNKEKLLKCSLSDNNLSNFTNDESPNDISKIHKNSQSSKLLFKKKKRYGEGIKNYNLDINTNNDLPVLPLFNNNEKKILLNVLPEEEIKKYEKRYECADAEKKNLQRLFAFETRQLIKENKDIKYKYELNNFQLKENEHKNNVLMAQIEGQTKEYEKLKNKMNNMMKEIEEKTKKLKQWEEENHTMALKLQEIKEKYAEIVKEEVDEEEELEEEEEEGDGDGDEETNK
jgi:exonuclease SbcC